MSLRSGSILFACLNTLFEYGTVYTLNYSNT